MTDTSLRQQALKRGLYAAVILLLVLAVLRFWPWLRISEQNAVKQLPELERHALYQRTLHNLASTCAQGRLPNGLEEFCQLQARFILEFPECDSDCLQLAKQWRSPTR
jgi:hypothetical protein